MFQEGAKIEGGAELPTLASSSSTTKTKFDGMSASDVAQIHDATVMEQTLPHICSEMEILGKRVHIHHGHTGDIMYMAFQTDGDGIVIPTDKNTTKDLNDLLKQHDMHPLKTNESNFRGDAYSSIYAHELKKSTPKLEAAKSINQDGIRCRLVDGEVMVKYPSVDAALDAAFHAAVQGRSWEAIERVVVAKRARENVLNDRLFVVGAAAKKPRTGAQ